MRSSQLLGTAASLSLAAAAFQAAIGFVPSWSAYFGAPEELLERPLLLLAAAVLVAALLVLCAAYAASGAGFIRPLPHVRGVLLAMGTVLLVRGLLLVPLVLTALGVRPVVESTPPGGLRSSAFVLLLGFLYLGGALLREEERAGEAGSEGTRPNSG